MVIRYLKFWNIWQSERTVEVGVPASILLQQNRRLSLFPCRTSVMCWKKLVNCLHYLSTRFIIMADSDSIEETKFTLNWGMILKLATESEEFRDSVSLTTLQHSDRQNPQCAAELMATWDVLKQAGFLSLSAYLKAGFLLLVTFYDKSLTVSERAENAWTVFMFFTLWGEHSKKFNTSENFITRESFKDLITAANGLVLYFVDLICTKHQ